MVWSYWDEATWQGVGFWASVDLEANIALQDGREAFKRSEKE